MQEMTSSAWQRRGSSVVFHPQLLGPLIHDGCLISLRTALGWLKDWPADPPGNGSTVLVGGLEAVLEVMEPEEAEEFLRARMRRWVCEFQSQWDGRGLVFGFGCSAKRFKQDAYGNVQFAVPGGHMVHLSESLWNGSALHDMYQILTEDHVTGKKESAGFYVRRS